jgi:integrase
MATILFRSGKWRVGICRKGTRTSATFDTHADAEKWAIRTEAAILAGAPAALIDMRKGVTVEALFEKYAAQVSPLKKGARWEKIRLQKLARDFPVFRLPIEEFDATGLCEWRDARLGALLSPYTINRELNLVSAVMNTALKEWRIPGLILNPVHAVQRPKNPRGRKQRVSVIERTAIRDALGWDGTEPPADTKQWAAFAFMLAIETAMRKSELLSIRWANVHLDRRFVHLGDTKNGDERDVPLSTRAVALLRLLTPGKPGQFVIKVQSGNLDSLFREAKRTAGCGHVRFHDSRREAATTMSKRLSNVLELAAVTGHRTLAVLKGYYEPDPGDLADKLG